MISNLKFNKLNTYLNKILLDQNISYGKKFVAFF